MTITQFNYLDLHNLIVNELFGGPEIATIFGLIIITYFLIRRGVTIDMIVFIDFSFIVVMMIGEWNPIVWLMFILPLGIIFYRQLAKLVKQ